MEMETVVLQTEHIRQGEATIQVVLTVMLIALQEEVTQEVTLREGHITAIIALQEIIVVLQEEVTQEVILHEDRITVIIVLQGVVVTVEVTLQEEVIIQAGIIARQVIILQEEVQVLLKEHIHQEAPLLQEVHHLHTQEEVVLIHQGEVIVQEIN